MPSSTINRTSLLAVSMGEPAGIGGEVILKSWQERLYREIPAFFVVGSLKILARTARKLGLDVPLKTVSTPDEATDIFPHALPVMDIGCEAEFEFGRPSQTTAPMVIAAIDKAVDLILTGKAAGLVTAPIQKSALYKAGFACPGHTEYLAQLCRKNGHPAERPIMMLVSDQLRTVPLTIHMALADVAKSITPALLWESCQKITTALTRDFGLKNPRIAVAGLNPHGGENGAMGDEEQLVIRPTLDRLRENGLNIVGPLPADTMFHKEARAGYDAALCMYHDQAMIPIKTLDFYGGVNVTIGLPLVRTSPDHGTALDIAGQNIASPRSMIAALKLAGYIYANRAANHV